MLNFQTLDRQRQKRAAKTMKSLGPEFIEMDVDAIRKDPKQGHTVPSWMTRAFQNNLYTVMVQDHAKTSKGEAICVRIQKHTNTPFINHWRTMQDIKNQLFGEETVAVEFYPKESELVDDYNIYWFWIFPEGIIPDTYQKF